MSKEEEVVVAGHLDEEDDVKVVDEEEEDDEVFEEEGGVKDLSLYENEEEDIPSDQWTSRWSFVLAAIGSAVGLGNFWRFPFQVYEYGGGTFFIPYLVGMIGVGIPLMQLEMAMGQVFRRSALQAFGKLHPRMAGIGLAAGWFSFTLVCYYVGILAWGNVMLVKSFYAEMPWSIRDALANVSGTFNKTDVVNIPANHFEQVILTGSPSTIIPSMVTTGNLFGALFMWFSVWLILIKGQEFISKAVYVTVLMPVFMLLILLIVGSTLDGAGLGIEEYLLKWDLSELSNGQMWTDAFGQVFFSLGIAYGIMPAYASLNPRNNNVVQDAVIVAVSDVLFAFFAGFAVFTIVGFFSEQTGFTIDQLGGKVEYAPNKTRAYIGGATLAFVTYPAGLSLLDGYWANLTCVMFFITFFFLGVDSAFSLIEATVLTMRETVWFANWERSTLTTTVIGVGVFFSLFYITDNGLYYLDFVDFYVVALGVFLVGFLECFTATWIFNKQFTQSKVGAATTQWFDGLFWLAFLVFIVVAYQLPEVGETITVLKDGEEVEELIPEFSSATNIGIALGAGLAVLAGAFGSVLINKPSDMSASDAYYYACIHGPDTLKDMLNRTITKDRPNNWAFGRAWVLIVKFFSTPCLLILLGTQSSNLYKNSGFTDGVDEPAARYFYVFYNLLGFFFVFVAILMILGSIVFPEKYNDARGAFLARQRFLEEKL